jgi:porphobilinogen synthase
MIINMTKLRKSAAIRNMLCETRLNVNNLIAPIFVSAIHQEKTAITSMPGIFQLPLKSLDEEITQISKLGIPAVILFGIPEYKDAQASAILHDQGIIQEAIRKIKLANPEMVVIADLCLCEYTDHGHCGILHDNTIDNLKTLEHLGKQALSFAAAGADFVAPSGMTDGMVGYLRSILDNNKFTDLGIFSYAVKYRSAFYGPFREAAMGAPKFGDRSSYQMQIGNSKEALREAQIDYNEGADIIMVKPAGLYLDIIKEVKQTLPTLPLCAYQVSGEYAMLKNAALAGIIHEEDAMLESITAIKRAGANLIITYFSKDLAEIIKKTL